MKSNMEALMGEPLKALETVLNSEGAKDIIKTAISNNFRDDMKKKD